MKEYLEVSYEAFIASYETSEVKGIRLSSFFRGDGPFAMGSLPLSVESVEGQNESGANWQKVVWCDNGYFLNADDFNEIRPGKHPLHEAGAYYIQEPSAMAPVAYMDIRPGDRVLDLCASPGGKSTQIAALLRGEGILVSNEIMPDRAKILSENIERMGVRNALVISEDPRNISDRFYGFFDKILVDAPCSGEGMFRRSDVAINEWSLDNVANCAKRQEWILDEAAKMLRENGTLCYSTCTFSKEENELQIVNFLERHEEFSLGEMARFEGMRAGFAAGEYESVGVRIFPHE
ncbi:MAG: RNA methyltransferase, partial [Lachnospiraceae bacterium]